ncbi:bifunctional adenosylcobinamide kinase/adenosylcobinamide-phosphate guanylyltransferase [Halomonas saccharevitans]|uniref:Bifunctional adenosylcobinamide kinase/adenosylcobinamide-phosphate guanylyltransferase n=1 Tax=Halomonas saccharevitans TaxID=416872 RepID=A0ABU3NHZ5_9GAMM|nr:bifunctional adenosylcobinamide kinase/adenosylcobinamide-phosphate guanylyltransferase [Halomonas saccharevitans]MDT8880798.1 bifunctional adenosylcobinamide kinase/adenosylcobinamide-phosphate guanylyltransferase [Halomonas saccharevitans]
MQLFIGGACAGKRDLVASRFPEAVWLKMEKGADLSGWRDRLAPGQCLVISGWLDWLAGALGDDADESDDDRLRARLDAELAAMVEAERRGQGEIVLILPEVGRGIVPIDPADRRLRDLAGWVGQDAVALAEAVWYVRHGLARCLTVT